MNPAMNPVMNPVMNPSKNPVINPVINTTMKPVMNQESHLLTTSGLVLGPKGPLVVALISVSVKSVFNTHRRTYLNTYSGSLDVCNRYYYFPRVFSIL